MLDIEKLSNKDLKLAYARVDKGNDYYYQDLRAALIELANQQVIKQEVYAKIAKLADQLVAAATNDGECIYCGVEICRNSPHAPSCVIACILNGIAFA